MWSFLALVSSGFLAAEPVMLTGPAPEPPPPPNALVVEPLAVVFAKTIALEYERRLTTGFSLALAPALALGEIKGSGTDPATGGYKAFGVSLAARFYPWSTAPEGAFIGPYGGVAWVSADAGDVTVTGLGWSLGGLAGYTWILGKFFVFSIGAGASWNDMSLDHEGTTSGKHGLYLATRLAIGGVF
ncbi:MAG: hypothetical protein U1F43_20645 [Myxococcota bacterium]